MEKPTLVALCLISACSLSTEAKPIKYLSISMLSNILLYGTLLTIYKIHIDKNIVNLEHGIL